MIRKKRVIYGILMLFLLSGIFPGASFAAWQQGDQGTADFTKILIGKDKKPYYINENIRTIAYSSNGTTQIKPGNGRSKVRWSYLKISNKANGTARYGYCAEFGAGFSDRASYLAQNSTKKHTLFQSLPKGTQKIIAAILCYGRNGSKKVPVSGANDADYYFATQVLIWEAQQGLRTMKEAKGKSSGTKLAAAHSMPAKHMYQFLKGRPAEKCYNWILKHVNDHLTIHSFAAETKAAAPVYTMTYDVRWGKWMLTLTDTNKKLCGFQCDDPRVTVSRKGNKYTLASSRAIRSPLLLTMKNKMQGGKASGKILSWDCTSNPNNQALIMGSKDLVSMYLKVQAPAPQPMPRSPIPETEQAEETGVIRILKNGELPTLRPSDVTAADATAGEAVTMGSAITSAETAATSSEGISVDPEAAVTNPETAFANSGAAIAKPGITITNSEAAQSAPLAGVVFQIAASEDITAADSTTRLKAGEVADILTTNQEGMAASKALYPGMYQISEIETPEGYVSLSEPVRAEIIETGEGTIVSPAEVRLLNGYQRGSVQIQKTDVSTGKPLPNTGIEILDEEKNILIQGRTDRDGNASFHQLPVGNYYFREFDAPKGYQIEESLFPFTIKEHGEIVKCQMSNQRIPQETKPKDTKDTEHLEGMQLEKTKEHPPQEMPRASLDDSPQTGDGSHLPWIWLICLLISSGIIFAMIRIYKRY